MGFNDESETDYLDSVKFCADLVWHGEIFNTNLENWKTVYVSEYQVKQEEAHPRPDTALVINIISFFNTVILFILVLEMIDDDDSGEHGRP